MKFYQQETVEVNEVQTYRLVDNGGNFFITLEQNAKASRSNYEKADKPLWTKLVKRTWKDFPDLEVFKKGYDKDYIYEKRDKIPVLDIKQDNFPNKFKTYLEGNSGTVSRIGKPRPLLTMRGAIKFNMWKRT